MEHTAAEVAALAQVPVAALRRYDEAGLVHPRPGSSASGPAYGPEELERLFLVLAYEEVGLDAEGIEAALRKRPSTAAHLRAQRRLLNAQRRRIDSLLGALATALEYEEFGPAMASEEKLEMLADWRENLDPEIRLPSQRSTGTLVIDMKS